MPTLHLTVKAQKNGTITLTGLPLKEGEEAEVTIHLEKLLRTAMTARELLQSGLVGIWRDRDDIPDSPEFARQLREQSQNRPLL